MSTHRAPKQWVLTRSETITSFESGRQNLKYCLSLDANFARFLVDGAEWQKLTRNNATRGFADDPGGLANHLTAAQKASHLEMMLGQIANYCPIISRNTIVRDSTSLGSIWQIIRAHFGFEQSGSHFLDLGDIKLENGERPEDLYQRLVAFFEDNLLTTSSGIRHHGELVAEDEFMTPTIENTIVFLWLQLIHDDLPRLVKQRYGTLLRSQSVASIKHEVSQALNSLLDEVHTQNDAKVSRSASNINYSNRRAPSFQLPFQSRTKTDHKQPSKSQFTDRHNNRTPPSCPICYQANRPQSDHFMSLCPYLPEKDKKFISRARLIAALEEEEEEEEELSTHSCPTANDTRPRQSPSMHQEEEIPKTHHVRIDSCHL